MYNLLYHLIINAESELSPLPAFSVSIVIPDFRETTGRIPRVPPPALQALFMYNLLYNLIINAESDFSPLPVFSVSIWIPDFKVITGRTPKLGCVK